MCCYDSHMVNKPLIETNPYLCNPAQYRRALIASIATSTAIETGAAIETIARMLADVEGKQHLKATVPKVPMVTKGSAR